MKNFPSLSADLKLKGLSSEKPNTTRLGPTGGRYGRCFFIFPICRILLELGLEKIPH